MVSSQNDELTLLRESGLRFSLVFTLFVKVCRTEELQVCKKRGMYNDGVRRYDQIDVIQSSPFMCAVSGCIIIL